ncbi:metalloregulator ArsR/SmtB family transcription factor [Sporichthya sp.]|uniref:ArsR/SmtB family transcription factor n=1 Tax=Sporichthya sp. TaxID=65475 RepID=UPI0017E4C3B9|nr:metalloregulator ArsR/SmtB family transcription factor [Sporichthya sp.]MBA3743951.1 helix-turn-helix transcriptional regulator [Sporichthya sp.]
MTPTPGRTRLGESGPPPAHLAGGPARVVDLVDELGLAQSTVSKHLACLRDCELVSSEPVGRASVFRLTQSGLTGLLGAAAGGGEPADVTPLPRDVRGHGDAGGQDGRDRR